MRILIDIGHPSFVHLFKDVAKQLIENNHAVVFSCRNKEHTLYLLKAFNLPHVYTGKIYESKLGKLYGLFKHTYSLLKLVRKFKPSVILSGASPYASIVSALTTKRHFVFDDTENKEQVLFYKLGSTFVVTPQAFTLNFGSKHIKYPGIHELAYLPGNVEPEKDNTGVKTVFVRFVKWNATHDTFRSGFTAQQKEFLVNALAKEYNVIVSSEAEIPESIKKFAYNGAPENIHDVLSNSVLYIGESATMAAEAACLNVPALFFYPKAISYIRWLEKNYGLVQTRSVSEYGMTDVLNSIDEIINTPPQYANYKRFINENIKLSAFMYWLVQHHKDSNFKERIDSEGFFNAFKV